MIDYEKTLEFIGEARAGISHERFSLYAVQHAEELIRLASGSDEARAFLSQREINEDYAVRSARDMLYRLHFNRFNDPYLALGLPHTASDQQINRRWKELMLIYHPDRIKGDDPEAYQCATRVNEVYNVLKDPQKRADLDRGRTRNASAAARPYPQRPSQRIHEPQTMRRLSPNARKALARMVIPACIAVSCLFLLVVYIQNRPAGLSGVFVSQAPTGESTSSAPAQGAGTTIRAPEPGASLPEGSSKMTQTAPADQSRAPLGPPSERSLSAAVQERQTPSRESPGASLPRDPSASGAQTSSAAARKEPAGAAASMRAAAESKGSHTIASPSRERHVRAVTPEDAPVQAEAAGPAGKTAPAEGRPAPRRAEEPPNAPPEIAPARSVPPVPAAASAPKEETHADPLSSRVDQFVARYTRAYNMGDVEGFLSLYSASAIENNRMNYGQIRQTYTKHFEGSKFSYVLKNYRYTPRDNVVVLSGSYSVKRISGGGEPFSMSGSITWTLQQEKDMLRIVKVEYSKGQ